MLANKVSKQKRMDEHIARYACQHPNKELRSQVVAGGAVQRVYQCLTCGQRASNAVPKAEAIRLCGGNEPPPFDEALRNRWNSERRAGIEAIRESDNTEFWDSYETYLRSEAWANKRAAVFTRANDVCEGCRENAATQVHHLSYEHVGNEFLFQLVAICEPCHERLHPEDKE
ncbi:MAG: hypothetical protein AB1832_09610 [Pseudomonadota bacterium]